MSMVNFFDVVAKTIQWGKNSLFSKWCWDNLVSTCGRMKLDPYLTPYVEMTSKWIKDLSVRTKSIKPLGVNIGVNVHDLGFAIPIQWNTI